MDLQEVSVTVTADALNVRTQPNSQSALVASPTRGTVLKFYEVVQGEKVANNPLWGHTPQGYYFWLGGTDHPYGIVVDATVTIAALNARTRPNTQAAIVASHARGTILKLYEVVEGENVDHNPRWGHAPQGYYFWLGGTDHPYGAVIEATVTVASLNARAQPNSQSALIATYSRGTVLKFYEVKQGESVDNNLHWGHAPEGYYFWLGGTDHPQG